MSRYMGHSPSKENPNWQTLKEHVDGVTTYYGPNPNDPPHVKTRWQTMKAHASEVARRAKANAAPFGEADRAHLAGYLHDLGKYGARAHKLLDLSQVVSVMRKDVSKLARKVSGYDIPINLNAAGKPNRFRLC